MDAMKTIEELKVRYRQFLCELGYNHPDTQRAKKAYFDECKKAEEEERNED